MKIRIVNLDPNEADYGMKVGDIYTVVHKYQCGDVSVLPPETPDLDVIVSDFEFEVVEE